MKHLNAGVQEEVRSDVDPRMLEVKTSSEPGISEHVMECNHGGMRGGLVIILRNLSCLREEQKDTLPFRLLNTGERTGVYLLAA